MSDRSRALPRQALRGLPAKAVLFVLLVTAARAAVMGWSTMSAGRDLFTGVVERSFPETTRRAAHQMDGWLTAAVADLDRRTAPLQTQRGDPDRALTALRRAVADSRFLDAAWLVSPGAVRGTGLALSDSQRDALLRQSGRLRSLALDGGGSLLVAARALPAARGGPTWIFARLRAEGLVGALPWDGLHAVGRGLLVDGQGAVSPIGANRDGSLPRRFPPALLQGEQQLLAYKTEDGQRIIAASRRLAAIDWYLVVGADLDVGFAPVLGLVLRLIGIDVVLMLLAGWLAYRSATRLVRPLEALWKGARRISGGDLSVEFHDTGRQDEIGQLMRSFNAMTRKLHEDQIEIESAQRQLRTQNQALQSANEILSQLSITDGLTKLHNHRFFQDHLTREIKRANRTGEPLCMLLIDIDDFKRLNDRYGHAAGDAILVRIAAVMSEVVRDSDLLARYGGEEFVVLASGTALEGALSLAEKLRMAVEVTALFLDDSLGTARVTISIGVAAYEGDRRSFFRQADRALYDAKAAGKNCVVVAERADD